MDMHVHVRIYIDRWVCVHVSPCLCVCERGHWVCGTTRLPLWVYINESVIASIMLMETDTQGKRISSNPWSGKVYVLDKIACQNSMGAGTRLAPL